MRFGLIVIAAIFMMPFLLERNFNWQTISICSLLFILLIFNFTKLLGLKELYLHKHKLIITHLFKFKTETHLIQNIDSISKNTVIKESGNGPNIIDFPSFEIRIKIRDEKSYKFNSRENLNLKEIYDKLKNIKPSC